MTGEPKAAARKHAHTIVEQLVAHRIESGMSVLEVAVNMGISPNSVRRFETLPSNPSLMMLLLYASATGSSFDVVDVEQVERRVEQRFMNGNHE